MVDLNQQLIDVSGVCQRLQVKPRTVYGWFAKGLESSKWGGKRLTSLEALERFRQLSNERAELLKLVRDGNQVVKERKRGKEKAAG